MYLSARQSIFYTNVSIIESFSNKRLNRLLTLNHILTQFIPTYTQSLYDDRKLSNKVYLDYRSEAFIEVY